VLAEGGVEDRPDMPGVRVRHRLATQEVAAAGVGEGQRVAAGAVTRLQVGPFASRAAALSACDALKQACFPVPAK